MRFLKLITLIFFFTTIFVGCIKKGDNDPLISIYKRSTRLSGVWKLKELQIQDHDVDQNGKINILIRTLTNDKYTETRGTDTLSKTYVGTLNTTLTITDSSSSNYSFKEEVATNGLNYTNSLNNKTWSWKDGSKKSALVLQDFKTFDILGLWSDKLELTITDINALNVYGAHSYVEHWVFVKL
ncbi:MAG: hypothetical protein NTW54_03015 [Bacteroidetes bacterium]|nr:hypothetical protein [Bacteroidota bacterium]